MCLPNGGEYKLGQKCVTSNTRFPLFLKIVVVQTYLMNTQLGIVFQYRRYFELRKTPRNINNSINNKRNWHLVNIISILFKHV